MLPPRLHGNPPPVAILAVDDEDPIEFGLVDDFHAVRDGEEPHAAGWLAARMRIVKAAALLSVLIERPCPILKRHLVQRQVARQAGRSNRIAGHHVPESLYSWHLTEVDAAIGPPWRRLRRPRRGGAASAPAASGPAASGPAASGPAALLA